MCATTTSITSITSNQLFEHKLWRLTGQIEVNCVVDCVWMQYVSILYIVLCCAVPCYCYILYIYPSGIATIMSCVSKCPNVLNWRSNEQRHCKMVAYNFTKLIWMMLQCNKCVWMFCARIKQTLDVKSKIALAKL